MVRYGIFSERQRDYLNGNLTDLDPDDERSLRGKIRQRADTAFAEFSLLSKLDERDRRQIFQERLIHDEDDIEVQGGVAEPGVMKQDKEDWQAGGGLGMGIGLGHLIRFTYLGMREQGHSSDQFGRLLKFYIKDAEEELNADSLYDDIEVTFDVETVASVDVEAAMEKHKRSEELSAVELKALVDAGELTVS